MPIRPSAGAEIRQLIEALGGTDDVRREVAVARLAVIGERAVERLLQEFPAATGQAKAGMLRAFEALGDPRALAVTREALRVADSPLVQTAAIAALRAFLSSPGQDAARNALDTLMAVALDTQRPAGIRLGAFEALRELSADVREPLRQKLSDDRDPAIRAGVASEATLGGRIGEEVVWREALDGRLTSPEALKRVLGAKRAAARLTELQRLVDRLRAQEQRETATMRREEWRAVRGAVHQALAARNSRLALYDLRDSLLDTGRLPVTFLAAMEEIGDATCLEALASAYDASSRSGDPWWREHIATAFRAIVHREGLTRRHAAVKRALARWPEATADLMARI
jgi:hypothetical protein